MRSTKDLGLGICYPVNWDEDNQFGHISYGIIWTADNSNLIIQAITPTGYGFSHRSEEDIRVGRATPGVGWVPFALFRLKLKTQLP